MRVFVLLFNARTENEGIHTIRVGDRNKILMFESQDDAERFAMMLEAQDFPTPAVEAIDSQDIEEFCQSADYDWEIVPPDGLVIPPEVNVEATDWNPDDDDISNNTITSNPDAETEPQYSDSELDSLRRRLEGLL
ncbi:DUF3110 domain-containing protein [Calothrix sp. UHCC 0171]|uniref:DUF3110 domain-containing protein n=1 Tax=Calothrix sp. UHCC 0171 TaxID=3110245 RepID=UPI002B216A58|nr:DUF3110 domain-containing protein [Calothrix sp. UHCC 0171]MEA5573317.1 DUF3110 domain-containing protein [Calothrix sp. UHCC 0171]